jgi:hypothetical protein
LVFRGPVLLTIVRFLPVTIWFKGVAHDELNAILPDALNQSIPFGVVLLRCVSMSFREEQRERRSRSTRAVGYLISEVAGRLSTDPRWHRDPFIFKAFRLALPELLDAFEPKGELRKPKVPDYLADLFETPESAAHWAVQVVLFNLFNAEPPGDAEAAFRAGWSMGGDDVPMPDHLAEFGRYLTAESRRNFYAMSDVRRDLEIKEPKKGD